MSDEAKHQAQAEQARKMHSFSIVRGAKLEATDLGNAGLQISIFNPNQPEDCVTIQLLPMDAYSFTSWLRIYTAKHRGPDHGKKVQKEKRGGN